MRTNISDHLCIWDICSIFIKTNSRTFVECGVQCELFVKIERKEAIHILNLFLLWTYVTLDTHIYHTRWPRSVLHSINCIRLNDINRLSYYNVKISLVYLDKLCWLKQNLVEQVHQCKVMLGWVSTISFLS